MSSGTTRPKIVAAARESMLARGYAATSVDQICSRAGVSKGSFYHFFAGKEQLGIEVLEDFYREGIERVSAGDYARISDPLRRLSAFLDHLEEQGPEFWRRGCLMGNFATELAESNPAIHARVAELFDDLVARVAPIFAPVARSAADARALTEEMLMILEGSIVMARVHGDAGRIAAGVRHFRRDIESRLPVPAAG